jgi:uncharacterized membrane protein YGL010W
MRDVHAWFEIYGSSHKNPVNERIHQVCIPVIVLSTLGLLQALPTPFPVHWGVVAAVLAMGFYASLSFTLTIGLALGASTALAVNAAIAQFAPIGWVSAGLFGAAWVAQFVGHHIEGKKPSFFQDLAFLLVGPAWLLGAVYARLGIPLRYERAS